MRELPLFKVDAVELVQPLFEVTRFEKRSYEDRTAVADQPVNGVHDANHRAHSVHLLSE